MFSVSRVLFLEHKTILGASSRHWAEQVLTKGHESILPMLDIVTVLA